MTQKKYEREILEILERLERQGPVQQASPPPRARRTWPRPRVDLRLGWDGRLWLALVLGLPLAGALLDRPLPWLASWLVVAGTLVFLSPVATALAGWARRDQRRMWRGRVIDLPYRGDDRAASWRYRLWLLRRRWERWRDGR